MYVLLNILIIAVIVSYTVYTLFKFFKRSKAGQCGSCKSQCHCNTSSSKSLRHHRTKNPPQIRTSLLILINKSREVFILSKY